MADGEMMCTSSSMPASFFRAFKSNAADAPRRLLVFPVMILPSGSSKAAAGAPVSSAPVSYTHLIS